LAMAHSLSRRGGHQSMPRVSEIPELRTFNRR
jgi:hypothetical protein